MKRIVFVFLMVFSCAFGLRAQTSEQQEDPKVAEMRQQIGIDYSIPDFKTKKIDAEVIGTHLAGMLNLLQKYYNDGTYNWKLSAIVKEQKGMLSQVSIDKMKITEISKKGDVISIFINTKLSKNSEGIKTADIVVVFDKGVSESQTANSLFSYLSRYVN